MSNQTINCDVTVCKHYGNGGSCSLNSITVTPGAESKTAHYCKNYSCKNGVAGNN